ncbi:hypothetical protein [Candidatus Pseudothioglobus singularis]|uniref:Uncharacterized protein n=1 Tax=Candidatus Pseudothioglobus singularis PS1 TaxID=1125411 RepID=A0A0M4LGY2_9GAMM|nr:hypothetical protein [Candidatus Pseudothioglobus singularis]ALE02693.1 hypothetical protein W908_04535 [Candidatus Pseudothioglobus singularis PS1]
MISQYSNLSSARKELDDLRKKVSQISEKNDNLLDKQAALEESDIYFLDLSLYKEYEEYCFPENIVWDEFTNKDSKPEEPKNVCAIFKRRAEWEKKENIPSTWLPFGKSRGDRIGESKFRNTALGKLYLKLRWESSELFPYPKWAADYLSKSYPNPYDIFDSDEEKKEEEESALEQENERVLMLQKELIKANKNQNYELANKIKKELES